MKVDILFILHAVISTDTHEMTLYQPQICV